MQDVLDMDLDFHESITGGSHVLPSLPGQIHLQCRVPGSAFGKLLQSGYSISFYKSHKRSQEKSESSSATPKSKYVQVDSVDGIQKTLRSRWVWTTMNTHEEKWPNMNKNHENESCHMPGRDTQGSLLRAGLAGLAAWTGGWTGWLASEGGPSSRGPKLDIRWQWAVNHLQHACTVVPVVIITSSTAQGGGGSFKNRKPLGEVGCCESGMS